MSKAQIIALLAGALGYFVDIFDILLFQIYRVQSLKELGVTDDELLSTGAVILNLQFLGLLTGGVFFGYLGDKLGRKTALFATIFLYSITTLLCAFVQSTFIYGILRFLCGFGLAGELGAAVTLVSEQLDPKHRGWGLGFLISFGLLGVIVASLISDYVYWRNAYILGGVLGLLLLIFRFSVSESDIFLKTQAETLSRGNVFQFFSSFKRTRDFLILIIFTGHIFAVLGTFMTFSPEISKKLGLDPIPVSTAIFYGYLGIIIGDFVGVGLSELLKSRLLAIRICLIFSLLIPIYIYIFPPQTALGYKLFLLVFYILTSNFGVVALSCAETFGSNFRALSTSSLTNFARATSIISITVFKNFINNVDTVLLATTIIISWSILGLIFSFFYSETYGKNLDFTES